MKLSKNLRPSHAVLAALIVATVAVLLLSGRPWRGYYMPRVSEIATLPDDEGLAAVRRYTEIGSGMFPWIDGERPELADARPQLRVGYAYAEYGILGMPYAVGEEYGLVTYLEMPEGIRVGAITPGQRPLLDELIGLRLTQGYAFRWYRYVWGWLFAFTFLLWIYLWWREDRQEEQRLLEASLEG